MIRDSDRRTIEEADRANFLRFDSEPIGDGTYPLTDEDGDCYAVVGRYRVRPIAQATHPRYRFPLAWPFYFHRGQIVERESNLIIPRGHAELFGQEAESHTRRDIARNEREDERRMELVLPNVHWSQGGGGPKWKVL